MSRTKSLGHPSHQGFRRQGFRHHLHRGALDGMDGQEAVLQCLFCSVKIDSRDLTSEERARVACIARTTSPKKAAQMLGISRESLLSLAGGFRVSRGTAALVRERLRELDQQGVQNG